MYQKYSNLLDHTAMQEISAFLKEKHSLEGFTKVIPLNFPSKIYTEHFVFSTGICCLLALPKSSLPLSISRKLRALITCGRRLPHCALWCPCPCFVCMLASWMMTCVTVLRDWKKRSSCLKWRRTEILTMGERKISASLNFCNLNNKKCLIDSTSNFFFFWFSFKSVMHMFT